MFTSIRRPVTLSMLSMVLALSACVDPRGRYDDYSAEFHFFDAGTTTGGLADITGTFLYSISALGLPPLQTLVTATLDQTGTQPKVSLHIQYLTFSTMLSGRAPIAEGQTDYNDVPVDPDTGMFTVNIGDLVIPATATSLGQPVTANDVVIQSTILTADFFCGTLTGSALTQPLDGSTFGAVRVQAGQSGADLPAPIVNCAGAPTNGDAGTSGIDGGASTPDAP